MSGIYQIECLENGRLYIGASTVDASGRLVRQMGILRNGRFPIEDMQRDYDQFGVGRFAAQVVRWARLHESVKRLEQDALERAVADGIRLYNRQLLSSLPDDPCTCEHWVEADCQACGTPYRAKVRFNEQGQLIIYPPYCRGIRTCEVLGWQY